MNSRSSEKTSPQLPDNTLTVYNCSEQDCGVIIPGRSWTWQWANGQIPQDSSSVELVFFGYTRCTFIAYTTPVVICKFMSGQFHVFWSIFLLQNKHEIRDARGRQKEKRFVSKEKRKREKEVRGLTETKRNETKGTTFDAGWAKETCNFSRRSALVGRLKSLKAAAIKSKQKEEKQVWNWRNPSQVRNPPNYCLQFVFSRGIGSSEHRIVCTRLAFARFRASLCPS